MNKYTMNHYTSSKDTSKIEETERLLTGEPIPPKNRQTRDNEGMDILCVALILSIVVIVLMIIMGR